MVKRKPLKKSEAYKNYKFYGVMRRNAEGDLEGLYDASLMSVGWSKNEMIVYRGSIPTHYAKGKGFSLSESGLKPVRSRLIGTLRVSVGVRVIENS